MPLRFLTGPNVREMLAEAASAQGDTRVALVAGVVDTMREMPKRARVRAAKKLDLAAVTKRLGADAIPLLRALLDDDDTRAASGDVAVQAWLALDALGCVEHALARLDEWEPLVACRVLAHLDPSEAFDHLAPRVESDAGLRRFIVDAASDVVIPMRHHGRTPSPRLRVFDDARWVDVALRLLRVDGPAAVELLRLNGSARADEELEGVLDRAETLDDVVLAALEAIEEGNGRLDFHATRARYVAVLARFLSSRAAEGIELSRFSFSVSLAAHDLVSLVEGSRIARERIEACRRHNPIQVRG